MAMAPEKSEGAAAPKKATAKASGKARGRPPSKNLLAETDSMEERFFNAERSDPLMWGSEQAVQVEMIRNLLKQFPAKISSASSPSESKTYSMAQKRMQAILDLMTVGSAATEKFRERSGRVLAETTVDARAGGGVRAAVS